MKLNAKFKPYLLPSIVSAGVLWGPWVWRFTLVEDVSLFEQGILIGLAYWLSLPAGGFFAAHFFDFPDWLQETLLALAPSSLFWAEGSSAKFLIWMFLSGAILAAMTVLGARGKWWLLVVATFALAFEILASIEA